MTKRKNNKEPSWMLWAYSIRGERQLLGDVFESYYKRVDRSKVMALLEKWQSKRTEEEQAEWTVYAIDENENREQWFGKVVLWASNEAGERKIVSYEDGIKRAWEAKLKLSGKRLKRWKDWSFEIRDATGELWTYPTDEDPNNTDFEVFKQHLQRTNAAPNDGDDEDWHYEPDKEYVDHFIDYKRTTETDEYEVMLLDGTWLVHTSTFHHWGEHWVLEDGPHFERPIKGKKKLERYSPIPPKRKRKTTKKKATKKKAAKKKATKKKAIRKRKS